MNLGGRTLMQHPASLSKRSDPTLHGNPDIRDLNAYIIDRTVGLVKTVDEKFVGTGTLVSIDDKCGILTARHVIEQFESADALGIVMPSPFDIMPQRFQIPIDYVQLTCAGSIGAEQPDVGIVILPQHDVLTISAKKSFYNLTLHGREVLENPPDCGHPVWILAGVPDEWSRAGEPQRAFKSTREFTLMLGFGIVEPSSRCSDFECLDFKVDRPEDSGIPKSFGGCSGGALWHVPITGPKSVAVEKAQLMGVAFEQACKSSPTNTIYCVGRGVIYKHMIDIVKKNT